MGVALGSQKEAKVAKADDSTATLEITSSVTSDGNLTDDNGKTWALTAETDGYTSHPTYIHVGSGSKKAKSLALESSGYSDVTIKEVHVWAAAKASSGVTTKISIDGNLLGTSSELGNTVEDGGTEFYVTNTNSYSGTISVEISRNNSTKAAIYFNKLTVVYGEGGGPVVTYTITYNNNGGSGEMDDTVGTNPVVAACTFTAPKGKVFSSWNTAADGSGATHDVGSKPGASVDLYAIWADEPYGIEFTNADITALNEGSSGYAKYNGTRNTQGVDIKSYNAMPSGDRIQIKKEDGYFTNTSSLGVIKSISAVGMQKIVIYGSKTAFEEKPDSGDEITVDTDISASEFEYFLITSDGSAAAYIKSVFIELEAPAYTATQFAQDLLDATDVVCTGWTEGTNNHDALVTVWTTLAGEGKYAALSAVEKSKLSRAQADESSEDVVEKAMARYDFLTSKYALTSFISGRPPVAVQSSFYNEIISTSRTGIVVIIALATTVSLSVGLFFVLKKKKHN